jgi:hypothetical protein
MRALNTLPIELFLEKYRIAVKSRQKSITLNMEEAGLLEESLAVVMARLAGELDTIALNMQQSGDISIKVDGGSL